MNYLDTWAKLVTLDRGVSLQYETGYRFDPVLTTDGKIRSLYTETDAHLRSRLKARFMKGGR